MNDLSYTPLVSVIIPTYNRIATLGRSISSVLSQTYNNIEIVVVDDGSSDGTEKYVLDLGDSRIKYLSTGGRKGACYARNLGARMATGVVLAFQDSDDVWLPHKLACQVEKLLSSGVDAVFSSFVRISVDMSSSIIYPSMNVESFFTVYPPGIDDTTKKLLRGNVMGTPTLLINRKVFFALGGFDEELSRLQDWDFAIRLFNEFSVGYVNEPLVNAYLLRDSLTHYRRAGNLAVLRILSTNEDVFVRYRWYRLVHVFEVLLRSVKDMDFYSIQMLLKFLMKKDVR